MQFKYPELLYALFLLLIPIIVHLFQLRRFQKEDFTNVAFLKEAIQQTRKSAILKKWLTLLMRLGLLTCLILAFAQPFTSKTNSLTAENDTVIYLDNSFSMQAKGKQGELLKRAVNNLIENAVDTKNVTLFTNNSIYKNTTVQAIKNELLQLSYTPNQLPYNVALLKGKSLFKKQGDALKKFIFISDFQQKSKPFEVEVDSIIQHILIPLKAENTNNIRIDSAYVTNTTASTFDLKVSLKNNSNNTKNCAVALYNNDLLTAKTATELKDEASVVFTLQKNDSINGSLVIEDESLSFDNSLFFNTNSPSKINVLSINEANDLFLKRIFTDDEFNYTSTAYNSLNYNLLNKQNLIVLNELEHITNALTVALQDAIKNNAFIVIIPNKTADLNSYNNCLNNFGFANLKAFNTTEKRITTIAYSHPIYNAVFDKKVSNFQYPKVNGFFPLNSNSSAVLAYENNAAFLEQQGNVFVFTSALNTSNSNFQNSPLIVPTFYNIAKRSLKLPKLYYTIGETNTFDVETTLQQDGVLNIENNTESSIPQQRYFNHKVEITTAETPQTAGIYSIKNKNITLKNISYNYDRNESDLQYQNIANLDGVTIVNSIQDAFGILKNDTKINSLWKWFLIFALLFLILELLILKYFK